MKPILYNSDEKKFDTNGLGCLTDAFDAPVLRRLDGTYDLTLVYPITGIHYDQIQLDRIILAKPNPLDQPQPFKIYHIAKSMAGRIKVNAKQIAHDLEGLPVAPYEASNAAGAVAGLKSHSAVSHPFTFSTTLTTQNPMSVTAPAPIWDVMGKSKTSILRTYGGEFDFDRFAVRLLPRLGEDRGVTIRYGKNLASLEQDENCAQCYSGVYPYWTGQVDGEPRYYQLPEKIVQCSGTYANTKILMLDLSREFAEQPSAAALKSAAQKYIKDHRIGVPKVSLKIEFVQPDKLPETIMIGDTVSVYFTRMGIQTTARVAETVYDSIREKYVSAVLGEPKLNIADTIVRDRGKNEQTRKDAATDVDKKVNQVKNDAFADATTKANKALQDAIADAKQKADKALQDAIADAKKKADAALSSAKSDATTKANKALQDAIADAKAKADAALSSAKSDSATKVADALTKAAEDAASKANSALWDAKKDAATKVAEALTKAAEDAASKANSALWDAKKDAATKVAEALTKAAEDAASKANSALWDAKKDATAKDDAVKVAASDDAASKANSALWDAKKDATAKANQALADAKSAMDSKITTYDQSLDSLEIFNKLTDSGTKQGLFRDPKTGDLYFNCEFLKSNSILSDQIHLRGKFTVYKSGTKTAGGYLGYLSGLTDAGATDGIGIMSPDGKNYIVATTGGVAMKQGTTTVYIANGKVHVDGDLYVHGVVHENAT